MVYVKVRKMGAKSWSFLTPRGGTNRLRVHATIFNTLDQAERFIADHCDDNPEWEFRVVRPPSLPAQP